MSIRKTPTILVVEDDTESRAAMLKVLEGVGYTTMEADNGQQALDLILENNVDIVVTDLRLPVMDGVELLKHTKAADQEIEKSRKNKSPEWQIPVQCRIGSVMLAVVGAPLSGLPLFFGLRGTPCTSIDSPIA
jgi:CheY-like chemotaxis protein